MAYMSVSGKIKEARKLVGLTQTELATTCGWNEDNARISKYERNVNEPSFDDLHQISKATGFPMGFFLSDYEPQGGEFGFEDPGSIDMVRDNSSFLEKPHRKIPLIGLDDSPFIGTPQQTYSPHTAYSPDAFAVKVTGDSMANPQSTPTAPEGSIVVVDPNKDHKNGDIVFASVNEHQTLKVYVKDSGREYLAPLNPKYPMIELADDAEILGTAVEIKIPLS